MVFNVSMVLEAKRKATKGNGLKIINPRQIFQRSSIALAQVKAGNNLKSLLSEIRQIIYFLHQLKEIPKEVYNNMIKPIQLQKLDTISMKSENSKTSEPHV